MKTIKFRAWDKRSKQLLPIHVIDFESNKINIYGRENSIESVKLMQYTGLKDKNGTDIFEGDILEVEKNEDGTYKGTINGKTFFDRFQGYSSKIKVEGMHDIDTLRYWNNRVRIIGNIYEDPELL